MEQALLDEIEDDTPVASDDTARRIRDSAAPGCLICALEEFSSWEDD